MKCDNCGTKIHYSKRYCHECELKFYRPISLMKPKGCQFVHDVMHIVNERNKTPKADYGYHSK